MKCLTSLYIKRQERNIPTKSIFKNLQNLVTVVSPLRSRHHQLRLKIHFVPRSEHIVSITQAKTRTLIPYRKYIYFLDAPKTQKQNLWAKCKITEC